MLDISVIVPLYNEEESLPELHAWIKRVMEANRFSYEMELLEERRANGEFADDAAYKKAVEDKTAELTADVTGSLLTGKVFATETATGTAMPKMSAPRFKRG